MLPAKNIELTRPAWVALRWNWSWIVGSTVGRIAASTEVMKIAKVVISSIHHEIGWAAIRQLVLPCTLPVSCDMTVDRAPYWISGSNWAAQTSGSRLTVTWYGCLHIPVAVI